MNHKVFVEWASNFNEIVLINSFLDQCYKRKFDDPFVASLDSLGFSYLKQYILHLEEKDRLSTISDNLIYESLNQLRARLNKINIDFNDYDSFLKIFKGEVKESFISLINEFILPVIEKDLSNFNSKFKQSRLIVFSDGDKQVGFPKETIKYINENHNDFKDDINLKIKKFDFSYFKPRAIYDNLDEILAIMYNEANSNISAMTRIHLFGIAYGLELNKMTGKEKKELIKKATDGKESLYTELAKGISLYNHVTINDNSLIPILRNSKYHEMELKRREDNNKIISNGDNTVTKDSNKSSKSKFKMEIEQFEIDFFTIVIDYKGGLMWNYKGKKFVINKKWLEIYKNNDINIYKVLELISLDSRYSGNDGSAYKVMQKINREERKKSKYN